MARIVGVEIPKEKRIKIGLTCIYGIGRKNAMQILNKAGINPELKGKELSEKNVADIQSAMEGCKVEGDLRREVSGNIKRLMDIGCYRGIRHRKGLPVRGQRTRTNARTRRGKRKTVGILRKEVKQRIAKEENK